MHDVSISESPLCVSQERGSNERMTSWKEYYALRRLPLQSPVGISAPIRVHSSLCLVHLHSYPSSSRRHSCMHDGGMTATLTFVLIVQPGS